MSFELQFLGAAGTVTGSKYLIRAGNKKILVDCGLFQGVKSLRLKNWEVLPVPPAEVDAIVLTHAHIDHSGYIPRLVKDGFRGKIYCTPATLEVCKILLPDCGYLQEEEAEYLNRNKKSKHHPAEALFTLSEAERALRYFTAVPFGAKHHLAPGISFEFFYAGHILGAASVVLEIEGKKIAFSGDVGRMEDAIFYPPAPLPAVDYLVTESTYGNRRHENSDPMAGLERAVNAAYARGGAILVPTFAVGRAQALIFYLSELKKQKRIPDMPMYLNSPMAEDVGVVFRHFSDLHRLGESECRAMSQAVHIVKSVEESRTLNEKSGPMLILAASGMLTGGRILHHLKAFVGSPANTVLLTGYQAAGTRGESLQRGAKEIKIHGEYFPVRAYIDTLENMSAHADYVEIIQWLSQSKMQPQKVFITHGEISAADEMRRRLTEAFGWDCRVPAQDETVRLG